MGGMDGLMGKCEVGGLSMHVHTHTRVKHNNLNCKWLSPPTHPPIGGGVSTNHKSSNRIKLS